MEGGDEAVDDVAVLVVVFDRVGGDPVGDREEAAGEEVVGAGVVGVAPGQEAGDELQDLNDRGVGVRAFEQGE